MSTINMIDTVPKNNVIIPHYYFEWDYKGYENKIIGEVGHRYMQHDWNQTLITKINQISNNIANHSWRGGATTIETGESILIILEDLPYFHFNSMMLGGRFKVIINRELPLDLLVVYHDCPDELKFRVEYSEDIDTQTKVTLPKGAYYGVIKVLNLPLMPGT